MMLNAGPPVRTTGASAAGVPGVGTPAARVSAAGVRATGIAASRGASLAGAAHAPQTAPKRTTRAILASKEHPGGKSADESAGVMLVAAGGPTSPETPAREPITLASST